jgi:hypothetical protein
MPVFELTSARTGQSYRVDFEREPNHADVDEAITHFDNEAARAAGVAPETLDQSPAGTFAQGVPQELAKVGTGAVQGAADVIQKGAESSLYRGTPLGLLLSAASGPAKDAAAVAQTLETEAELAYPTNPFNTKAKTLAGGVAQGAKLFAGGALGKAAGLGNAALTAVPLAAGGLSGVHEGVTKAEEMGVQSPEGQLAMGLLFGTVEAGTEKMFGFGNKAATDALLEPFKKPAAELLKQAARTVTGEGVEEMAAGTAQDLITRAFAQEDPANPGFTKTGVELPKIDRKALERRGLEFLGGAAGGTVFAGAQTAANLTAPTAPQTIEGKPLTRRFTARSGGTVDLEFEREPTAQDLVEAQAWVDTNIQPESSSPAEAAPPANSVLAQIAARGGRTDAQQEAADTAPKPATPMLGTDFDTMPDTGAEIVFDTEGTAVGWVPAIPAAPAAADAPMPEGINAPPATALPGTNPASAANDPAPAAYVAAAVAPPVAPSTDAATPAPAPDIRVAAAEAPRIQASRAFPTATVAAEAAAVARGQQPVTTPPGLTGLMQARPQSRQPSTDGPRGLAAFFQAPAPNANANASTFDAGVIAAAHAAAMQGSSTPMVPIRAVFEQAQRLRPGLTPEAFLQAVQAADNEGSVFMEPANTQQEIDAAQGFVVPSQSGPGIRMMPVPRVSGSRRAAPAAAVRAAPGYFIAEETNQPIFPTSHERNARSVPADQNRDPGKLAARVGERDSGTNPGEFERADIGAVQSEGRLPPSQGIPVLSAASLQAGLASIRPKIGGEHDVYLDDAHGVAVKMTRPGELGADGGNLQAYLQRLDRSNRLFHDGAEVMGWVQLPGEAAPRLVTTQPLRLADKARPEPTQKEIDVYMRAHGFLKAYDGAYLHETQDLAASDAVPKNFVRTREGHIHAVDVITVIPGGAQYDRLQAQVYNEAQVPLSALPPRGVTASDAQRGLAELRLAAPGIAEKVQLVPSLTALNEADFHPDDWAAMRDTEGFYDPRTGEVIVILDQIELRDDEPPVRAAMRVVLHERIGHAGLAALRESNPKAAARWEALVDEIQADEPAAAAIAALRQQGYEHLTDSELVEEWFARQVERMTPQQLQALKPAGILGRLWQWLKDMLGTITFRFKRRDWTAREMKEIMALSRQALERGGPRGDAASARIQQSQALNPFHTGDLPRQTPNWLRTRFQIPSNAPFRVQALGLRSILRGSPLPAELVPFVRQSERDITAVRQSAAQLGADLNAAVTAYAQRAAINLEAAHALVAQAMEFPAVLNALGDAVLKERVRRARNFLDDLSAATAAYTGGELGQAILQNRGHWMRRSYAAFDPASNWTYDNLVEAARRGDNINGVNASKILDDARSYIEQTVNARRAAQRQRGVTHNVAPVTASEIEAMMRQLTDRNTWERNLLGNMGGSGISKDTTSLMHRADYHPDVKAWMRAQGLREFDYQTAASLASTGGNYQGRNASQLLDSARSHLQGKHAKATLGEINDMLRLKDIPAALRALMGEEVNPVKRFLNSAGFQAQFIARHEQQQAMRDLGLQAGLFSVKQEGVFTEELGDSRARDGFKIEVMLQTATGQQVPVMRPIYTTPELAAAMRTAPGVSSNPAELGGWMVNALRFIGSEAKLNKVALNPDSWMVNALGNMMGLIQSGDLIAWKPWENVARAIQLHRSVRLKDAALLNVAEEAEQDLRRDMLARLTAAGVANSGLEISDIEAALDNRVTQFINQHDAWNSITGGVRGAILGNGLGRPFGWIGQAIGAGAGAIAGAKLGSERIQTAQRKVAEWTTGNPDRIAKLASFYGNYEAHLAAGMSEPQAFKLATEKTLNTMPDYSQLPALMRELSRLGLMGSFIGFQYEVYRNAYWNARYGLQELRSGNAVMMSRGVRRLSGLSSMLSLAAFGLSGIIRATFGSGVDDEEDEAYRRALGADHERFGNLAYTKLDSEGASFFNTSYLLPQVTLFEVIKAGFEGRDLGESLTNIGSQLTDQFVQGSVHLDPLIAAWTNRRDYGGKVSFETGARSLVERIAYFLYVTMEPGALNKEDRIVRAIQERGRYGRTFSLEEELKRFLGVRQNSYTHEERIKSKLFRFRDAYDDARNLARTAWRQNDPNAPAVLERANARIVELQREWDEFQSDLQTIGVPRGTFEEVRKAVGTAKTFAPLVIGENGPESERARTVRAYQSDSQNSETERMRLMAPPRR